MKNILGQKYMVTKNKKDKLLDKPVEEETSELEKESQLKKAGVMGKLFQDAPEPPTIGDLVEGPVIAVHKNAVFIDLSPYGTGIIYGKEFIATRDIIKKI